MFFARLTIYGWFFSCAAIFVCLVITIQREPVSAVSSDINFPMKGRRGMKDWARTAEDKLCIPKEVFTAPAEGMGNLEQHVCPWLTVPGVFFFMFFGECNVSLWDNDAFTSI